MTTPPLIAGSGDNGEITCGPLPGIANTIECSVPDEQSVVSALTPMIACRSEPAPLSLVLVTVKVVDHAGAVDVISPEMDDAERKALEKSIETLREAKASV